MKQSIRIIMGEYNIKTSKLNEDPIMEVLEDNRFHYYPDTNELNNDSKRTSSIQKVGDQRSFVEYMKDFENKDDKTNDHKIKKRGTLIDIK